MHRPGFPTANIFSPGRIREIADSRFGEFESGINPLSEEESNRETKSDPEQALRIVR